MNIKELEIMLAFQKTGTITEAAKKVNVSRSNASRTLKKLQDELQADLFISTSEGIIPTLAGEIYLDTAKKILIEYREMLEKIR